MGTSYDWFSSAQMTLPDITHKQPPSPIQTTKNSSQPQRDPKNLKKIVDSVDWIVSNAVLEQEIARLTQRIAQLTEESKPHEDEDSRLSLVATKINDIAVRIQTGTLTVDDYTANITKKIAEEKVFAKELVNAGDKITARACLLRAHIMEKELANEI